MAAGQKLLSLCQSIEFVCTQLIGLSANGVHGNIYDAHAISQALNLFLRSIGAYKALRQILILSHEKTLRSFFGKFGSAGNEKECLQAVQDVFSVLNGQEKFVYISAEEIYVKPAIRFRVGHISGFAQNQEKHTAAKTVLALMINFMLGTPAFVARLIPVLNLKHTFLWDTLRALMTIVHQAGGYVFAFVTDNLSVNQKAFKQLHDSYVSTSITSIEHPIENEQLSSLYTLYGTTHLFKNIRNYWVTEKTKTREMLDPDNNSVIVAKWKHLVDIYTVEESSTQLFHSVSKQF